MRFEKKDFEASLECCLGEVLPGEEGVSDTSPILGETAPFSVRICMSMFVERAGRPGDRGGDLGDCVEAVERALKVPIFGECGPSLLVLFRSRGGTFGALGILTKRAYPVGRLQVTVDPCFSARCRLLRWRIVSRSVGLQPANCLPYHHTGTVRSLILQPCRVRRSRCFRVSTRSFVVVLPALSPADAVGRTDVMRCCRVWISNYCLRRSSSLRSVVRERRGLSSGRGLALRCSTEHVV